MLKRKIRTEISKLLNNISQGCTRFDLYCFGLQKFDPFSLSIEGDKLRGRGTTDCLGHVALLTELMKKIAQTKLNLKSSIVVIFIVSEENNSIPNIGVERLYADGYFDILQGGPL